MSMSRNKKREAEIILKGEKILEFASPKNRARCRAEGRGSYAMTPAEYAEQYLGRHDARGMAATRKLTKMGYIETERGSWKRITRK